MQGTAELIEAIDTLISSIDELTEGVYAAADAGAGGGAGEKEEKGSSWAEKINQAVTSITGVSSEMLKMLGVISALVADISPSTFQAFQQAILDLTATIGSAFVPVLQIATSAVREISGIILPLMRDLQPLLQEIANAIADRVVAGFRLLVSIIQALHPVLELVTFAFSTFYEAITNLINVVTVLVRTLGSFFGTIDGAKDFFRAIGDAVKVVIRELVLFGALLGTILGFTDTVGRLGENFRKLAEEQERRDGGLVAAARNPAIEGIESISKKFQAAALVAAGEGGARDKTDTEFLKDIASGIENISKTSPNEWQEKIKNAILEAGLDLLGRLPGAQTARDTGRALDRVTDRSATTGARFAAGRQAGGVVGGLAAGLTGNALDALNALNPF